ncbi:MAG: ferritin-like domain-containing protein [Hydrogenophaga sp.]|nr:ferritin-like domain-containing protein [Hydrogenophaga sp.]
MQATPDHPPAQSPLEGSATSLRVLALQALCTAEPADKCRLTLALFKAEQGGSLVVDPDARLHAVHPLPGRPELPLLIPPMQVPHRSPLVPEGLAALVHAVCHIEFNAINLALDAVWRFPGLPVEFYRDWLRVAAEEATHFGLLSDLLQQLGFAYGDFPAHDGLWEMCVKTQHDVTARMALVPRTLEARGLDATPLIQARLRKVNTPDAHRAIAILDVILRDEIGHVAVGNRWYRWLCERDGLEPVAHYRALARQYNAPRLRPPFNDAARRLAGFSQEELDALGDPA